MQQSDLRLFSKGKEDDLNHHRNSLIKSKSATVTPNPLAVSLNPHRIELF